jgi:signal transduction histidine kinase
MISSTTLGLTLVSAGLGLVIASWVFTKARQGWRRTQNPIDLAMQVTSAVWALHLIVVTGAKLVTLRQPNWEPGTNYLEHVGLQALVLSLGYLMLSMAGVPRSRVYLLLPIQALAGLAALHWHPLLLLETFAQFDRSTAYKVWIGVNLLASALLTSAVARQAYTTHSNASWLALSACLMGFGLCIDQLILASHGQQVGFLVQPIYALFLLVVWQVSLRKEGQNTAIGRAATFSRDFPLSVDMELLSDFGPAPDVAAVAVAQERRRIGQDLHDGVASQLVNILSSLDTKTPQNHAVSQAIEQCLVDLKLTVDALDSANDTVVDALGRLRYRVQHSLDKLGIRMSWRVELRDELEAVQGDTAQHALRIAQEAISNAMLHARASAIEVVCRFVPENANMVLEIRDNGKGMTDRTNAKAADTGSERRGKGLSNMRHRAKTIGGQLSVSSKLGQGTRVRLMLPMAALLVQYTQDQRASTPRAKAGTLVMAKVTDSLEATPQVTPSRRNFLALTPLV